MQLRERGWSILAAARDVGVSRTTGNNWARGYKTYRKGAVVGFVAPLERLAVRTISARYLSQDERIEIADLHHAAVSIRAIAVRLGRAPSTISRELRRNVGRGGYRPFEATGTPPRVGCVTTVAASTPILSCTIWSRACSASGGARNRSVAI